MLKQPAQLLDARFIAAFVHSVSNVFRTMMDLHVMPGEPCLCDRFSLKPDVSGIIAITGEVEGVVVLSFDTITAECVVKKLTGLIFQRLDEDFADAIGELVNMIAGNAKARFPGTRSGLGTPTVVIGEEHRVFQESDLPVIEIPCACPQCGPFHVRVALKRNVQHPGPAA